MNDPANPLLDPRKACIERNIESMFSEVGGHLDAVTRCLADRDLALCESLIEADAALNEKHRQVEHDCLATIASQQPVAHDLRDIIADMHIAEELERMGDYACDIATAILQMDDADLRQLALPEVQAMAGLCQRMLSGAERAHRSGDAELALQTSRLDDEVDALMDKISDAVLDAMRTDAANIHNGCHMLRIAHDLERCGDRLTNIAEQVVFRLRGEVVDLD